MKIRGVVARSDVISVERLAITGLVGHFCTLEVWLRMKLMQFFVGQRQIIAGLKQLRYHDQNDYLEGFGWVLPLVYFFLAPLAKASQLCDVLTDALNVRGVHLYSIIKL